MIYPVLLAIVSPSIYCVISMESNVQYGNLIGSISKLISANCLLLISNNSQLNSELAQAQLTSVILFDLNFFITFTDINDKDLMIVGDDGVIRQVIERVRPLFKTRVRVFLMLEDGNCTQTIHQQVFNTTWSLRLRYIVLIEINCKFPLILFNPFNQLIDSFPFGDEERTLQFLKSSNYHQQIISASLFPSVPTTVKIGDDYLGVDPMVVQTIEQKLNVNIIYHEPYDDMHYGSRLSNGTVNGAIKELYERTIDVAFNQVFIKYYNAPELEFTTSIFRDQLCVIVPKAELVPTWMAIFFSLPRLMWIFVLVVFIASTLMLCLMRRCKMGNVSRRRRHLSDYTFSTVFTDVNQIFCSAPYSKIISNRLHERIFMGFILIHNVLIFSLFQGSLVTVITRRPHQPNINTLEDLAESRLLISSSSQSLSDTFNSYYGGYMDQLQQRLKIITQREAFYDAWLTRESKFHYLVQVENNRALHSHLVKECPKIYLLAYMALKDSYFVHDFNIILEQIAEAGLVNKWYSDVMLNISYGKVHLKQVELTFKRSFSITDLQTSFYILMTGFCISFGIFCLEMMCVKNLNCAPSGE